MKSLKESYEKIVRQQEEAYIRLSRDYARFEKKVYTLISILVTIIGINLAIIIYLILSLATQLK